MNQFSTDPHIPNSASIMNNLLRFSTFHLHSISWSWLIYYIVSIVIFSFCITNLTLRELFMVIFFLSIARISLLQFQNGQKTVAKMGKKVLKITIKERRRYAHLFRIKYVISCFLHTHSTYTHTHTPLHTERRAAAYQRQSSVQQGKREKPLFMPLSFGRNSALCRLGLPAQRSWGGRKTTTVTKGTAPVHQRSEH